MFPYSGLPSGVGVPIVNGGWLEVGAAGTPFPLFFVDEERLSIAGACGCANLFAACVAGVAFAGIDGSI